MKIQLKESDFMIYLYLEYFCIVVKSHIGCKHCIYENKIRKQIRPNDIPNEIWKPMNYLIPS